ncbi:MAG TPA: hypothetical protein VF670_07590 [Duganella sp.]
MQRGDTKRAAGEFAVSVTLKTSAYAKSPNDRQLAADLADSLSWQASAQMQSGQLMQAKSLYERALTILQPLNDANRDDTSGMEQLAGVWSRQSELKQALGDVGGSLQDARKALTLSQSMVEKDPTNVDWQRKMHIAQLQVIDTDREQTPAQSLIGLEKLRQIFSKMSDLEPERVNLQILTAKVQLRKAAALIEQRQLIPASRNLQPALDRLIRLNSAFPSDISIRDVTIEALFLAADLGVMQGERDGQRHCTSVRTMLSQSAIGSTDFQLLAPWVKAHACLNRIDQVRDIKKQLEAMSYRDASYLHYLSTHPS